MLPLRLGGAWLLVGWVGVVAAVAASLWPGGVPIPVDVWDKVQHGVGYFLLTLWFAGLYPRAKYLRIALACLLLGLALEGAQALTATRTWQAADLVANAVGVGGALLLAYGPLGGWAQHVERLAGLRPAN
jgi:VanZ family protein